MEDMLNAMDDDWPVKPGDVDDTFDPQEVFPRNVNIISSQDSRTSLRWARQS